MDHFMDDPQAITRLKKGDISGLELLISRYQGRAFRTAFLITNDKDKAEDVVQDTFLRIYQRIGYFDEERPFEPYLLKCVAHAALNIVEKFSRQVPLSEEDEPLILEQLLRSASTIQDQVEYAQMKQEIFSELAKLSPRERMVIVERYYLEMSEKEMAVEHSIAPGTVKWLLNQARLHLRTFMKPEGEK
jgi:RNA polymerase sigma-70 factor, ECF subfamily